MITASRIFFASCHLAFAVSVSAVLFTLDVVESVERVALDIEEWLG